MIKGHGDDIFQYRNGIRMNFSSNVYGSVSHDGLNAYLCSVISCIRSYPEPEPYSLERLWAEQLDIVLWMLRFVSQTELPRLFIL